MNLRWILRDGKQVLQQQVGYTSVYEDVPTEQLPQEPIKPREFWICEDVENKCVYRYHARTNPMDTHGNAIHVTELPKGSRVVSREEAYAALIGSQWIGHNMICDVLKRLGFPDDK